MTFGSYTPSSSKPSRGARLNIAVFVLFVVVSLIMTWPLALHLGSSVIGPFRTDNFEYIWKIYWVKHALFDLGQSPWIAPDIYYPNGYLLAYGEITPLHTFWGLPITLLTGEVTSYNLFILFSTILSGYFTYLWVLSLTRNQPASILAGVIFAFCPYRMARIAGHLPLVSTEGFPLFFLGIEQFVQKQRLRDAGLAAIGFATSTLSSWYYGVILALAGVVYVLTRIRARRAFLKTRHTYLGLGMFLLIVLTLVGPFVVPYLPLVRDNATRIPLEMADFWSASLLDFALPNVRHPIWGDALQAFFPVVGGNPLYEFILSWGLVTTVLGLYGWRWAKSDALKSLRWLVVVSLVLSLGMTLHLVAGLAISLPVGKGIATSYNSLMNWLGQKVSLLKEPYAMARPSSVAVPLPGLLLRWFVPGMGSMRTWARFAIVATFGAATLAGLGLDSWYHLELVKNAIPLPPTRRKLWMVTALFTTLVLFEFWTGPQSLVRVEPRAVDRWLAQQPGQFTIMQYPLGTALNGDQMLYTRYHGKRVAFGYGTYLPILFKQRHPELIGFPDDASLDRLAEWGVRYVLLDVGALPSPSRPVVDDVPPNVLELIKQQPRLQPVGTFDDIQVYRLQP